jgi:putative flavoprotein involved in K+ transport
LEVHDVAVVGGGQAGISLSYYLQQRHIPHVILERQCPFSSWRNRWDGFRANTPNWMNTLPFMGVAPDSSKDGNAFATKDEIVAYFESCLNFVDPPVESGVQVDCVRKIDDRLWELRTSGRPYRARCVAICSGAMSLPKLPASASTVPDKVPQIHSSQYRSPGQIATGSVLVVGSASSGVQICRLLCESERFKHVHLSQSNVLVLPSKVLGIPIHRVIHALGLFNVTANSTLGRIMYSGLETKGDPIMRPAPADLRRNHDVKLHGKFLEYDGEMLNFAGSDGLSTKDLTIVWCTGFKPNFEFLDLDDRNEVFQNSGYPKHSRGVVDAVPGLFFVGLRYQHTVASHDIYGVGKDAEFIAGSIQDWLGISSGKN